MTNLEKYLYQLRRIEEHRSKAAEKEIRKIYKELLKELNGYLGNIYATYSEEDVLTYAALAQAGMDARFLEEVEQRISGITPQVANEINTTVNKTYEACFNGMQDAVIKAAGNREVLKQSLSAISAVTPDVIKAAVENPVSGLTLKDTLEKHRKDIIYDIKKHIGVGLSNGDRFSTMAKRISESLDGDYKKSVRIVRTEAHRVRESGFNDAASDINETLKKGTSGYVMAKTWRTMQDSRVRPNRQKSKKYNHEKMDGVTIPQDELFKLPSGAVCMCPSKTGVAGEDINCRCYLSYDLVLASELTQVQDGKKSIEEAAKVEQTEYKSVNEAYSNVSLTGIDKEFKAEIEDELLMLANKYPINTKEITIKTNKASGEYGHAATGIRGSKRKDGYYALTDIHIAYNKDTHKTAVLSQKHHEITYSARGSKLAKSANAHKATIAHEYAHHIDHWYLLKKKPELYEIMQEYKQPKLISSKDINIINNLNRTLHSDSDNLSRVITKRMQEELDIKSGELYMQIYDNYGDYAAGSASEFLAEAFTNMLNLDNKDKTDFMKLFEKIFNEEFDKVIRG